jgi:hypothetical protein
MIDRHRFIVASGSEARLLLESSALFVGVVELGESVGEFTSHGERFKALGEQRVTTVTASEW